jgi:nicotinamidase-related amidase
LALEPRATKDNHPPNHVSFPHGPKFHEQCVQRQEGSQFIFDILSALGFKTGRFRDRFQEPYDAMFSHSDFCDVVCHI